MSDPVETAKDIVRGLDDSASVETLLEEAKRENLRSVIVLGVMKNGEWFSHAHSAEEDNIFVWLAVLEKFKHKLHHEQNDFDDEEC